MKIWELHGLHSKGLIRTTAEGHADIGGLVLSEKAYLIAIRDFRPADILELVQLRGPSEAAQALIAHYGRDESLQSTGGRGLAATRGLAPSPMVCRSDEVREAAPTVGGGWARS
jgi:hypothetical protein